MNEQVQPKADTIANEILEYIRENDLQVGSRIPNEYNLAEELQVGRSTLREGIKILVTKNILEVKRGSGTFLSDKRGMVEDPLGLALIKDKHQLVQDAQEIRFLLEPQIAALAARNASPEGRREIEYLCDEVDQYILEGKNHLEKDIEFHAAIARHSGNSVMMKIVPIINQAILLHGDITKMSLKSTTSIVHRDIVKAINKGDETAAHDAMYLHLVYNRREIKKIIEGDASSSSVFL